MKDVQNAIYSIVETRGKRVLLHFMPCNRHRNRAPADHAEDADNLQRGSYPNGKENEWSCFAGIEPQPRIFGRMAADGNYGPTGSKNRRLRKN